MRPRSDARPPRGTRSSSGRIGHRIPIQRVGLVLERVTTGDFYGSHATGGPSAEPEPRRPGRGPTQPRFAPAAAPRTLRAPRTGMAPDPGLGRGASRKLSLFGFPVPDTPPPGPHQGHLGINLRDSGGSIVNGAREVARAAGTHGSVGGSDRRGGQYLELPTSPRPAPASKYECPRIGRVAQSRDRAA